MDNLTDMYSQQFAGMDPQATMDGYAQDTNMNGMDGMNGMNAAAMDPSQTQTLDQIIDQNNQELMRRRRSLQDRSQFAQSAANHARRASMMEFNPNTHGDLADFQFDPNPAHNAMSGRIANGMMPPQHKVDPRRARSRDDLSLDTRMAAMGAGVDGMSSAGGYNPSMVQSATLPLSHNAGYLGSALDHTLDFEAMSTNVANMNMQNAGNHSGMYTTSPMATEFPMSSYQATNAEQNGGSAGTPHSGSQMAGLSQSGGSTPQDALNKQFQQLRRNTMMLSPLSNSHAHQIKMSSPAHMQPPSRSRRQSMDMSSPFVGPGPAAADMTGSGMMQQGPTPAQYSRYSSAYSSSGFDMLGVLMRVATRQKPEINIGPVDLACAFVVCDIAKHDLPIVYCSDMFERLTGYTRYEILGRNCRFLQAPDGKVQSGVKRKYVDDKSVLYLKNQINKRAEAQLSLINYRKGGQPFMNLLTMIPIPWDTEEYRFFVGFQVDLVEQPNSVSAKNPDGTYEINYNRSALPAYQLPQPDTSSGLSELGQTIPRDEVSQVLTTIGNGESELSKRIWDKVLLENTDDVVHVLSLKGLFLYLSPACRKTLEYDPSELVGTPLSSVCHPSDIVPVTRELKDSSNGASVNVVYRIRRKNSGYTWFEAHGCLHTEHGKGRKCIILTGRQRPVYALDRNDVSNDGGIGDSELWAKMSTSGSFLFVSSNARSMLDRLPEDLVGTSMQALMRTDSRKEFGRALEIARSGEKHTFTHDLQNRRGQILQAQTTVYPGDSRKGSKPTFLLSQTRLMKMTRAMIISQQKQQNLTSTPRTDRASLGSATPFSTDGGTPAQGPQSTSQEGSIETRSLSLSQPGFPSDSGVMTQAGGSGLAVGSQDEALASEDNLFDELRTTRSTSWQFELRQMERQNRLLAEELQALLSRKKKRKRRKGLGQLEKDCANCHTRVTPEWRRGPSGNRDLCNSCGLRWAKQNGRVSPRGKASGQSDKSSTSPAHISLTTKANSKENSADTAGTSQTPVSDTAPTGSQTPVPKAERDSPTGNMPPTISEGQEPPHPDVLPT